jgi:hypothetical protein
MTTHDWIDLVVAATSSVTLVYVFVLLGQRRYWKRIARLHENARIDAQIHATDLQHANEALRRALGNEHPA